MASELREVVRRWIGLWCAPVDWAAFDELHAAEFRDHASAGRPPDREGFAAGLRAFVAAFPDLHTRVEDLVVDEAAGKVAVRWRATGTNRARYLGVGPTERRTEITGIEIVRVADGRIVERWGEWDVTDHLRGASAGGSALE